jgi:hypothetical protein
MTTTFWTLPSTILFAYGSTGDLVDLNEKEVRALRLLGQHTDACDEKLLLTHGITVGHLAGLVIAGFAAMRLTLAPEGGRESLVRMKISEAVKAIAE